MREAEGFLLVYSITKRATFEEVEQLHVRIMKVKEDEPNVPIVLVGNKCDLHDQRQVSVEEGRGIALEWGCKFFETSAKEEINNVDCFFEVARAIRDSEKLSNASADKRDDGICNNCQCQCIIL